MKKTFLTLGLLALMLVSSKTANANPTVAGGVSEPTNVYLNLTRLGRFEGSVGNAYPELGLENAILINGMAGAALPGASQVTASNGATFLKWVSSSDDGLHAITQIPALAGTYIYQAWWAELMPPLVDGSSSSEPTPTGEVYLSMTSPSVRSVVLTAGYSTVLATDEYSARNVSFTAGEEFSIKSTSDLFQIGATTYPSYVMGFQESGVTRIGYTLSAGGSNLTASYLEEITAASQSGTSGDGKYIKYISPLTPAGLRFKTSGTYNIYITFWDQYSWVRIYVEPTV